MKRYVIWYIHGYIHHSDKNSSLGQTCIRIYKDDDKYTLHRHQGQLSEKELLELHKKDL